MKLKEPYTPEEQRKIDLVKDLMEKAFKRMDEEYDKQLQEIELEWMRENNDLRKE